MRYSKATGAHEPEASRDVLVLRAIRRLSKDKGLALLPVSKLVKTLEQCWALLIC